MSEIKSSLGAEAYPPLRSLVVYPREQVGAMVEGKNSLNFAALSDMLLNGRLPRPGAKTGVRETAAFTWTYYARPR